MQPFQFGPAAGGRPGIPQHDQGRSQFQQTLDIERCRLADARNPRYSRRIIAGIVDADHPVAGTRRKQQFGDVRAQADDSWTDFRGPDPIGRAA